jgi:hypothetical protein
VGVDGELGAHVGSLRLHDPDQPERRTGGARARRRRPRRLPACRRKLGLERPGVRRRRRPGGRPRPGRSTRCRRGRP